MIGKSYHSLNPDSEQSLVTGQRVSHLVRGLVAMVVIMLLSGCVGLPSKTTRIKPAATPSGSIQDKAQRATPPATSRTGIAQAKVPDIPRTLWSRLRNDFRLQTIQHPRIQREIKRLQAHPESFIALVKRAEPYLYYILGEVEARSMPGELALLPAVESGFRPFAYSPTGAAGLWQFMPATGRILGLHQNRLYDGRRDILRSTEAALSYLTHLKDQLDNDWLHALAAYNCGIGTVQRAIRKAQRHNRSTSYWQLDLPGETDSYVPRLLAMAQIIVNPEKYGLELPEIPNKPYFDTATVDDALDLELAAELAEVPLDDLLDLNPAYRQGITLPDVESSLLLPIEKSGTFRQALTSLPKNKWLRWADHKIRKGDTLIAIARHYHVSVDAIRRANHISGHTIRAGKWLHIPLSGRASDRARRIATVNTRIRYRVRKGDSLYDIARRFSVSIRDLKRWNRVGRYIRPGQRLTVYVNAAG